MNADEFQLLAAPFDAWPPSVLDQMTPPTLDEWTAAICECEQRITRATDRDWFERAQLEAMRNANVQYGLNLQNQQQYYGQGLATSPDDARQEANRLAYLQQLHANQQRDAQMDALAHSLGLK